MLSGSNNSRVVFPEAPAEFITERKEGLLEGTRIVPASEEATTCSGNKSILPSWLLLDPDSLWAFEYKYGEGSSPGIVPAGSMKVKWKAWKLWRHESHIHTDWCHRSKAKTHPQRDYGAAKSHWFWIFRVDVLIPSLPRRKLKLKGTQSFPKMKQQHPGIQTHVCSTWESDLLSPWGSAAPFLEIICLLCAQGPLSAGLPSAAYSLKLLLAGHFLLNFYFIFGNTQILTQTR